MKTAAEIRSEFLKFFQEKEHTIVDSSPVVPKDDPTLYFTNAGMNQFKDVFLGTGSRSYKRAADTQKCIRVSGKHNDLEVVGRDTYHHTFFEMLGNWSFGDYFKKEAIGWAWELLTKVWQIPKEIIWVTVFGGDQEDGLAADEEAAALWASDTDVVREHITRFGKKDNFWEMGETGPCGPCSEIHIDRGPDKCNMQHVPGHKCQVNGDCIRFIEIWNLVFIQFNRQEDRKLVTLPAKHVDTGMGLERVVALLQGKMSNYDTDLFTPILQEIGTLTGKSYGNSDTIEDMAFRVISDHVRTLSAALSDGGLPSNSGRGYVLRRILRRAVRFGHKGLDMKKPFIYQLVPKVAELFANVFPEIAKRKEHVALVIRSEEEAFLRTLDRGIELFGQLVEEVKKGGATVIPGDKAYQLYHQDGFPRDLVDLMAREQNLSVDDQGWTLAEQEHKERSQGKSFTYEVPQGELEGLSATLFLGYAELESGAAIIKMLGSDKLILNRTPFYAECGGQIGDTGMIYGKGFRFAVHDTQKFGDISVHFGELLEGDLGNLPKHVSAHVDRERRRKIMANHTATHLLHWALHQVIGEHAMQQGSHVGPARLRFDFTHPQKVTSAQVASIERLVNSRIYENIPVRKVMLSLEKAKEQGAIALFGEKYGENVRVVSVGRYSKELCGGTHVFATGDIGSFRIVAESAVQAGVRRIEAVTRDMAVQQTQKEQKVLDDIRLLLKVQDDKLATRIAALQEDIKQLKKQESQQGQVDARKLRDELLEKSPTLPNGKLVVAKVESMGMSDLRNLADLLRKASVPAAGIVASVFQDKVFLVAFVGEKLTGGTLHAGEWLKAAAGMIKGGGDSRRADFAQGQGSEVKELDAMLETMKGSIEKTLQ
jgi:alanyl-tRNA synthetase